MISNLAEEMTAAKTTLHELGEDLEDSEMTETCEKMSDLFRTVEQQLGSLITNSQHFGKLKYEESVSQKMDILTLYSESLIRANEETLREIKEINELLKNNDIELSSPAVDQNNDKSNDGNSKLNDIKNEKLTRKYSIGFHSERGRLERQRAISQPFLERKSSSIPQLNRRVTFNELVDVGSINEEEDVNETSTDNLSERSEIHQYYELFLEYWSEIQGWIENLSDVDYEFAMKLFRQFISAVLFSISVWIVIETFLRN